MDDCVIQKAETAFCNSESASGLVIKRAGIEFCNFESLGRNTSGEMSVRFILAEF